MDKNIYMHPIWVRVREKEVDSTGNLDSTQFLDAIYRHIDKFYLLPPGKCSLKGSESKDTNNHGPK